MLVFEESGKPEYPEKNFSEQRREPTTNSTTMPSTPGFEPWRWWDASALTTAPPLLPFLHHREIIFEYQYSTIWNNQIPAVGWPLCIDGHYKKVSTAVNLWTDFETGAYRCRLQICSTLHEPTWNSRTTGSKRGTCVRRSPQGPTSFPGSLSLTGRRDSWEQDYPRTFLNTISIPNYLIEVFQISK